MIEEGINQLNLCQVVNIREQLFFSLHFASPAFARDINGK